MNMKVVSKIAIAVGMLALISVAIMAQNGNDLFQQALVKERTEGNLQEAIKLYQTILQKYGADHKLAARALYQLGQAYEKLGSAEARKAYERIARDFGDQKEVATDADRRLAVLSVPSSAGNPGPRLVLGPDKNDDESISPDGRSMAITIWSGGDNELAIRDMSTGQLKHLLPGSCGKPCTFSERPVLSPDSRQVAFTWYDDKEIEGHGQLRVLANETAARPRVLVRNSEFSIWASAWSPDRKSILVSLRKNDRTWQLGWVSMTDGSLKVIKSLQWRRRPGVSLSPDGRYITYAALATNPSKATPGPTDPTETRIYILAADGSSEAEVVKTASVNGFPVWTPDGAHIVFTSNLSGKSDLWSIAVQNGKAVGSPSLLRRDIGEILPIGMTRSGSYYYAQNKQGVEQVFIAELTPGGASRIVSSFVGIGPAWSPDGKFIAFSRHSAHGDSGDLVIRSLEDGDEKVYMHDGLRAGPPRWFHDSKTVLQNVTLDGSGATLVGYSLDSKSGEFKRITTDSFLTGIRALSPDDKTLYFLSRDPTKVSIVNDRILAVDLNTKKEKEVLVLTGKRPPSFVISPDGRRLLVAVIESNSSEARLALVNVDGTGYREIYASYRSTDAFDKLAWTKDGRSILFADEVDRNSFRIMRIGIDGGKPEFTGLAVKDLRFFDVSPDGSRIAFQPMPVATSTSELYVIDNLPALIKESR
jgi:Tol biopolymer transport system component